MWIDNPFGSIDVIGGDGSVVAVTVSRSINAPDLAAMKEAADAVGVRFEGDPKVRLMRTVMPMARNARWSATVDYVVHVPKSVAVKIGSKSADHIRVSNINGSVTINGFGGTVIMEGVNGASAISMVNGKIIYDYTRSPMARAEVQAVNADIDIQMPASAKIDWIANTLNGDILTTFPTIRGRRFSGTTFHGQVNGSGGPTINTTTLMGRVLLQAKGSNAGDARSMRFNEANHQPEESDVLLTPPIKIQLPFHNGDWPFIASVADITVGEIRGNARIQIGAGEVELGVVFGQCNVTLMGVR